MFGSRPGRAAAWLALALALSGPLAAPARAADRALWIRRPAISPDGRTIVFCWQGNLWSVPARDPVPVAKALTVGEDYNTSPVWSPDGQRIAFASDRNGNFDVYVMPAAGGPAKRLTFNSADEIPSGFTPDGRAVLFSAAILQSAASALYPNSRGPELYQVSVDGGMPRQLLTTPALGARWDPAGRRLAYYDKPGFEMEWRKHDHSAFARQVWTWDPATNRHTRLTAPGADHREPVWNARGDSLWFLSEESGSFNVWRMAVADPAHAVQVTRHAGPPVRFLSVSDAGDVCYTFDGALWLRPAGAAESREIVVGVATDRRGRASAPLDVSGKVTDFDVSPDGSEIAFTARGEVFVASAEHGDTRRITNTAGQERGVRFSPDGRTLLYASERGTRWQLWATRLTDPKEPNFFNATALRETLVLGVDAEAYQPRWSPDGTRIAYLENRSTLKVLDLKTGRTHVALSGDHNYSYTDGDQSFEWCPDGRWIAVQFMSPGRWSNEVGLVPAEGDGPLVDVSNSGFEDNEPHWSRKGEVLVWKTNRQGLRANDTDVRQTDVWAAFLTRAAWDRFQLGEAAYAQVTAKEKDAKGKGGEKDRPKPEAAAAPPVAMDLDRLEDRTARLSLASADLATALLTPDGETLVYLARVDKGYDLWKYVPRSKEVKRVAVLGARAADFELDREGKKAFVLADGRLQVVELESGKATPVAVHAVMELDADAERAAMFEHVWRQTKEKFLDPGMHGADWTALKAEYARFLPSIDNGRDFAELVSEMQGELNASHSGGRYRPQRPDGDATASLGFFPDTAWHGAGVRVAEVVDGGPLRVAGSKVGPGTVIEAIDGVAIAPGANWDPLLNRKAGANVRLALFEPKTGAHWEETARPIDGGALSRLLYKRWIRARHDRVVALSGGRIGYAHIRGMDDGSYREMFQEVFGPDAGREAIVLDTRWNGGGNLVEALTQMLSGRTYATDVADGRVVATEPEQRWTRPTTVVMGPGNYSDAHCFPMAYTELGLGETVGMPVPGTCSSVWWETLQDPDIVFGIPEVTLLDMRGQPMENHQLEPTWLVPNDPAAIAAGRDEALEKAVDVLLKKLPTKK